VDLPHRAGDRRAARRLARAASSTSSPGATESRTQVTTTRTSASGWTTSGSRAASASTTYGTPAPRISSPEPGGMPGASRPLPLSSGTPAALPRAATPTYRRTASSAPCARRGRSFMCPALCPRVSRLGSWTRWRSQKRLVLAEEKGFEPLVGLPPRRFSKPLP
jgi:hypothetical protein